MATPTQNILENIISQKIVSDGAGGYLAKTDIVNVDVVQHSLSQCGQVTLSYGMFTVSNPSITATSIVLLTASTNSMNMYSAMCSIGQFTIMSSNTGTAFPDNSIINYFIARY